MRYTKVSRDGKVTEPAMAQLAYGALLFGRTNIIRGMMNESFDRLLNPKM
jgi:acyl-CoA oxidase